MLAGACGSVRRRYNPHGMATAPESVVRVHGMRIDPVDMGQTLEQVERFVSVGGPHHIVTADASMVVTASTDREFSEIVDRAALVTPDGAGILWASRRLGLPFHSKVSGVDLAERLVAMSPERGWNIFFLGAAPGIAEAAAANMKDRYPGCRIVGVRDGFFGADQEEAVAKLVRESGADILLVALGIPKQEKFIARWGESTGAKVLIGVGGTLDVFSGTVQRAPVWMQRRGLEWLYRLVSDPRQFRNRVRKQKLLPRFVWMTLSARPAGRP